MSHTTVSADTGNTRAKHESNVAMMSYNINNTNVCTIQEFLSRLHELIKLSEMPNVCIMSDIVSTDKSKNSEFSRSAFINNITHNAIVLITILY